MVNLINSICQKKILVIGDAILDIYFYGDVNRISPEAPVPIFLKQDEKCVLGGAANVVANLVAANQQVSLLTVIGSDARGTVMKKILDELAVDDTLVLTCNRRTTAKTRLLANHNQQIVRLDEEEATDIDSEQCNVLLSKLGQRIDEFDLIVISDYMKGLLTPEFTQAVIKLANQHKKRVIIDVKDKNYKKYQGAFLIKPNLNELQCLTELSVKTGEQIIDAALYLRDKCSSEYVLTTLGADGMVLVGNNKIFSVDAIEKEVFDVTGAGDTVLAYLAVCLANDVVIEDAIQISNFAAALQVAKVGTSVIHLKEITDFIQSIQKDKKKMGDKLLCAEELSQLRKDKKGKKIVFTNGCFDILHAGHISYLQKASELGEILVIGLNSDTSVRRLKGEKRPITNEKERALLLCALGCVDYVVIFEEDTPYHLIQLLRPDVLVKGGDYEPNDVVGKDIVESDGGKVEIIPYVEGRSTSKIINFIRS